MKAANYLLLFASLFIFESSPAAGLGLRQRCWNFIEPWLDGPDTPSPLLSRPFYYILQKDNTIISLFVTSPVPAPLSAVPRDLRVNFSYADLWVGVDFNTKAAQSQFQAYRNEVKRRGSNPLLSRELSKEAQAVLADAIVRDHVENGSPFRRMLAKRLQGSEIKQRQIRSLIDPLSPFEAYQILRRVGFKRDREVVRRFASQSLEHQLLNLKRKPKLEDFLKPDERKLLLDAQFLNFTPRDLEQVLHCSNRTFEPAGEAYLSGNEEKAHGILNDIHHNQPERLRLAHQYLIQQILIPKVESYVQSTLRPILFVNFHDAFGEQGLLNQLKVRNFAVRRRGL